MQDLYKCPVRYCIFILFVSEQNAFSFSFSSYVFKCWKVRKIRMNVCTHGTKNKFMHGISLVLMATEFCSSATSYVYRKQYEMCVSTKKFMATIWTVRYSTFYTLHENNNARHLKLKW